MTTAIFGGAFDPPHVGHVALLQSATARFGLDRILVVPTGHPPHKAAHSPPEIRFRLAQLAFQRVAGVELWDVELHANGPSYTIDTLRAALERFPGEDMIVLVGADQLAHFLEWRDPEAILELARLGVATRPGYPRETLEPVLSRLSRPDRVELFRIPSYPLSSSALRGRLARGESVDGVVPRSVATEIERFALYR
ncbi:MAG: nicotinate-nucleotide adenylyltransferase [Gaiellaceae bacterium]|nr:nicotinate-nucleotide adenylyltransferase [Gaiellaceae bacterium]